MRELKYSIDNNGHGLIEMPCGTGKTITILSFLIAYKRKRPDIINKIGQGFSFFHLHVGSIVEGPTQSVIDLDGSLER